MEDMIRRIVEMDRAAQEVLATAQTEKLNAETQITEKIAKLQKNYLDQARRRIQIDTENERTQMEQKWAKRQSGFDMQQKKLQQRYDEGHDAWLKAIVETATKPAQ